MEQQKKQKERFPENVIGDFYVENQVCIACGAPEAEAPDLMEHSKIEYGHCYFKKQPETEDELNRAIDAMDVSCIAGIRYGGNDESILKRLYKLGLEHACDYEPIDILKYGVKSLVEFQYFGTIQEFYGNLMSEILAKNKDLGGEIVKFSTNTKDYFEFIYSPNLNLKGTQFVCSFDKNDLCKIELRKERDTPVLFIIENGDILNQILRSNTMVQNVVWYNTEGKIYNGMTDQ